MQPTSHQTIRMGERETAIVQPLPSTGCTHYSQEPHPVLTYQSMAPQIAHTYGDIPASSPNKQPSSSSSSPSHSNSPPTSLTQQSSPASLEYQELCTVPNAWNSSPRLDEEGVFQHHHHYPSGKPNPWASVAPTPDIRRSIGVSLSGADLSLYSTSDRSADSLGSLKLASCGEFPSDYDSLKGSSGTLDMGYGSMVLSGLISEQRHLGSLKELSYSEVASTLLSLKQPTIMAHQQHASSNPTLVSAVAPIHISNTQQSGRPQEVPTNFTSADTVGRAREDSHHEPPNHHLYYGYDASPANPQFHTLSSVPTGGCASAGTGQQTRSASSLERLVQGGPERLQTFLDMSDPSHRSDAPYWAFTPSATDVSAPYPTFDAGAYQATSPRHSAQLISARPSVIKSTGGYTGCPTMSSTPYLPDALQRSGSGDVYGQRSAARHELQTRGARFCGSGNGSPASLEAKHHCSFCSKTFSRQSTLKTHIKTHVGRKPYLCQLCGKSFYQAANLTTHIRVHSGEKPFSCNVCGKHFSQSSSVKTHMRTHSGERPYKCTTCSLSFSDNSTLTKHQRIHTGQKPYRCSVCQQSFSQSGNLSRHMKIHMRSSGDQGDK